MSRVYMNASANGDDANIPYPSGSGAEPQNPPNKDKNELGGGQVNYMDSMTVDKIQRKNGTGQPYIDQNDKNSTGLNVGSDIIAETYLEAKKKF